MSALVFIDLDDKRDKLFYGYNLEQTFLPDSLYISITTQRLYHPLSDHKFLQSELGLFASSLSQSLSQYIKIHNNKIALRDDDHIHDDNYDVSRCDYYFSWKDHIYKMKVLEDDYRNN
jgi:hypothetical protein